MVITLQEQIQALSTGIVQLNPQYANAHFFLGVMYAIAQSQYPSSDIAQLQAVAGLSAANATAVAPDLAQLQAQGKNPFPPSQLGALGIPQPGKFALWRRNYLESQAYHLTDGHLQQPLRSNR